MSTHHILIIIPDGKYQATCKPCNWESKPCDFKWQAKGAGDKHAGVVEEQHPPWARGPG